MSDYLKESEDNVRSDTANPRVRVESGDPSSISELEFLWSGNIPKPMWACLQQIISRAAASADQKPPLQWHRCGCQHLITVCKWKAPYLAPTGCHSIHYNGRRSSSPRTTSRIETIFATNRHTWETREEKNNPPRQIGQVHTRVVMMNGKEGHAHTLGIAPEA